MATYEVKGAMFVAPGGLPPVDVIDALKVRGGSAWAIVDAKNRPPGETNRPRACTACNGAGGLWKEKKYVDQKGKAHSERFFETCRACGGSGNK